MRCRFCNTNLEHRFISLGSSPLSNSYLNEENLDKEESVFPLEVYVCSNCFLVQLDEFETPENIFGDYAYFSSYSEIWLKHAKTYVDQMIDVFGFNKESHVIEIASNDGYLLQFFLKKGINVLGIEPAANIAEIARQKGVPTETLFFGVDIAKKLVNEDKQADLLLGNNVLAHVPDINDFVQGFKILLKPAGIITMEFPHLMRLVDGRQFDTIYHEHFSYFSFLTVQKVFSVYGLNIFDVEELSTHGGSLRIYACHKANGERPVAGRVAALKDKEIEAGYMDINHYLTFSNEVKLLKQDILNFFIDRKKEGKSIVGYGAPAKGNTLLNYCGIKTDLMEYTVDRSPHKQGYFLPGSHIPVYHPDRIKETKPDYLFILPWNIKDEVMKQMSCIRDWGGKFVVPIPSVEVIE